MGITHLHLMATHTHSSFGGFQTRNVGSLFMGHPRPAVRKHLLQRIDQAMSQALERRADVISVKYAAADVMGLTMNRRVKEGQRDDSVRFVQFELSHQKPILILSTSGHPVVVYCKQLFSISADYPGRLRRVLASHGYQPLFLTGAVGACNILFPEMECSVETHLGLLENLIMGGFAEAQRHAVEIPTEELRIVCEQANIPVRRQRPPRLSIFAKEGILSASTSAVGNFFANSLKEHEEAVQIPMMHIGPLLLTGMPADYSVFSTMRLRDVMERNGFFPIITSQTNGYIGYMHPEDEYTHHSAHKKEFFHYENAMTWYGRDVADLLAKAAADTADRWSQVRQ